MVKFIIKGAISVLLLAALLTTCVFGSSMGKTHMQHNQAVAEETIQGFESSSERMLGDSVRFLISKYCEEDGYKIYLDTIRMQELDLPSYEVKSITDVSDSNEDFYLNPAGHFLVTCRKQADGSIEILVREEVGYYG